MRALSNVREKALDEETKIDLISAILAAGARKYTKSRHLKNPAQIQMARMSCWPFGRFESVSSPRVLIQAPLQVAGAEYGSAWPHRRQAVGLAPIYQLEHDQDGNRAKHYGGHIQRKHSHVQIVRPPLATDWAIRRASVKR
jgi:hypothetical protein